MDKPELEIALKATTISASGKNITIACDDHGTKDEILNALTSMVIDLSAEDISALMEAIEDARAELCCGPGLPEANAIDEKWADLARRLGALGQ